MRMFSVYILFPGKLKKYYIGSTDNVESRLLEHNSVLFNDAFTRAGIPWEIVLIINDLESRQAYNMEKHIKLMKSAKYIQNLIKYQEMREKLILRFK